MLKRTLSIILVLVALVFAVSFSVMADASDFEDNALAEYIMYEDIPKSVTVPGYGDNAVCIFIPEYSDTYTFTSNANSGTVGALYLYQTDADPLELDYDNGYYGDFEISYYLEVGNVYMLATRYYSYYLSGTYTVTVTSNHTHTYDNSCDTSCNVCSKVREVTHTWQGGNCKTPSTCSICGTTGNLGDHAYDNTCDDSCNICGALRAVTHNYATIAKKATTTTDGYTVDQCAICNDQINYVIIYKASDISLSATSYTYNGNAQKPTVIVKDSNGNVIPSSNYTVSYSSDSANVGTYTVVVNFTGNYADTKTLSYKITKQSASKLKISLSKTSFTYNGKAQKPTVTVKDSSGKTVSSSNYTVSYSSGSKKVGTYTAKVTFKGNYSGTKSLTYKINKQSSSKVTVTLSKTVFAYNGKVQTPTLKLKDTNGNTLKNKTDYTISYSTNRKKVGKQTIKITYKGNYSGTKTLTYTIAPTAKTSFSGYIGDTFKIGAKSNTKITYSSSNKKVATVSSKGVITAAKAGTATITVKSGKISRKITVKVATPTISLKSNSSMYIGTTQKITATTTPKGKVTWSVNDKKIAKISSSGKLTALKGGDVTVTAKLTYKGKTYKKTCKVKITVEYPDISVFISSKIEYSSSYAMIIENKSDRPIKILDQGYVYCGGDSADIDSLFALSNGSYDYFKSLGLSAGSSRSFVLCLDEKIVFLKSRPTYAYIYIEYGGETFKLSCSTNRYGVNKCHTITWMRKS